MESKHFKDSYIDGIGGDPIYELACPCCDVNGVKQEALDRLELMRHNYGKPMVLNSAYRCPIHNNEVASQPTSSHLKGYAFDIKVSDSRSRFLMICAALNAGFNRIGIANMFIHVDRDPDKPVNVLWTY